jgi:hypothetical protein
MEAGVTAITGVPKGERAPERRLTNRNGYQERRWDTRVGWVDVGYMLDPVAAVHRSVLRVIARP